jgi:mRNA interferase RelE/StbE
LTYRVEILPSAIKELGQLPIKERKRIDKRIQSLAVDPRPPGVVAMQGSRKGLLRLRVGNYRVIYSVEDQRLVVIVVKVGHRQDIYR